MPCNGGGGGPFHWLNEYISKLWLAVQTAQGACGAMRLHNRHSGPMRMSAAIPYIYTLATSPLVFM